MAPHPPQSPARKRASKRLAQQRGAQQKEAQAKAVALSQQAHQTGMQQGVQPKQWDEVSAHAFAQHHGIQASLPAPTPVAAPGSLHHEPQPASAHEQPAKKRLGVVVDPAMMEEAARPQLIPLYPKHQQQQSAAPTPVSGPSPASCSSLPEQQPARTQRLTGGPMECGLWGVLPDELIEIILKQCSVNQLAQLESTCRYFRGNKMIERVTKQRLRSIPRAKGLRPSKKEGETHTQLLHYVQCQSSAAAQATSISCGAYHSAVLMLPRLAAGSPSAASSHQPLRHMLYTFGRGFHGQLGLGSHSSSKNPATVTLGFKPCLDKPDAEEETMPAVVACGAHHTTAISRKGELFSWGLGCHGELGLGRWSPLEQTLPRQCSAAQVRIVSVACGAGHTLAIAENGSLWSCGQNRHGQLGNGTMLDGLRLQVVLHSGASRIVSAAAGVSHSMALASDGSLFTWGDGSRGQLGHCQLQQIAASMPQESPLTMITPQKIQRLEPTLLAPENRITAIAAGAHHSMALTVGGNILAFGANSHGQLGLNDTADRWKPTRVKLHLSSEEEGRCLRVVQVACGASFSLALFSNQGALEMRSTGANAYGQLGQGDRLARTTFRPVMKVPDVVAVQAGDEHSAAVTSTGDLHMWGRGDSGQLGMGDSRAKWKPALLKDFVVVHPDKTLRRTKRSQPFIRPIQRTGKADKNPSIPVM